MTLNKGAWYFKVKELYRYLDRGEIPNAWHESGGIKIENGRQNYPKAKIKSVVQLVNIYNMLGTPME